MATKIITTNPGGTDSPSPSVTVTHYEEEAAAVMKLIDAVHTAVPAIEVPVGVKLNTPFAMVKEEFLSSASGMYNDSPDLQSVRGPDMATVRDSLQFAEAFRPVLVRLEAEARHLKLQLKLRRVRASAAALQVYGLAKGVSQATEAGQLDSHLDTLKRQVTPRRKKKAAKPSPTPAPAAPASAAPAAPSSTQGSQPPAAKNTP